MNKDQEQILLERKQVNSQLGISAQWKYLQDWLKVTDASPEIKRQALENFKLLAYKEWYASFLEVDILDDAPWRIGHE